jgi:glyoxylase-like metal-dependent hydrolase (beta-lactamase superfamily II)
MIVDTPVANVTRISHASTNCYLIESTDGLTFVDAGLPRTWRFAEQAVHATGRVWTDVKAIVLTHAHFDHLGFALRAQQASGADVWVHEADRRIAEHPYRYQPGRPRLVYPLTHPRAVPHLTAMTLAGALQVKGLPAVLTFADGAELDVPGGLRVVATPGHTDGHCALQLGDQHALFSGDGLVTLDPYTGRTGPRIVARAGTKDREKAIESLDAMAATGATIVLPGHGEPWTTGVVEAARLAREAGAA